MANTGRHVHIIDVINGNLIVFDGGDHESDILTHQASAHDQYIFDISHVSHPFLFRFSFFLSITNTSFMPPYIAKAVPNL